MRAFHAAAPFPNPPDGLVAKDGLITFAFSFYFEIGAPRTSWRVIRSVDCRRDEPAPRPPSLSIVLIGATLSPVLRKPWDDGFPLSTYRCSRSARPTMLTMDYALGVTAAGERRYLTPRLVGSGEVLQALEVIAAGAGRAPSCAALCATIAARVAAHDDYRDVARSGSSPGPTTRSTSWCAT